MLGDARGCGRLQSVKTLRLRIKASFSENRKRIRYMSSSSTIIGPTGFTRRNSKEHMCHFTLEDFTLRLSEDTEIIMPHLQSNLDEVMVVSLIIEERELESRCHMFDIASDVC